LPGYGDPGVKDGEEHPKGKERKKVVLEFEGEVVGTLRESLGESQFGLQGSKAGPEIGVGRMARVE
jgi:hypothetical protein